MCFTDRTQPRIILVMRLPVDEGLGILCPSEDALFTIFSNLFVSTGRDILTELCVCCCLNRGGKTFLTALSTEVFEKSHSSANVGRGSSNLTKCPSSSLPSDAGHDVRWALCYGMEMLAMRW